MSQLVGYPSINITRKDTGEVELLNPQYPSVWYHHSLACAGAGAGVGVPRGGTVSPRPHVAAASSPRVCWHPPARTLPRVGGPAPLRMCICKPSAFFRNMGFWWAHAQLQRSVPKGTQGLGWCIGSPQAAHKPRQLCLVAVRVPVRAPAPSLFSHRWPC
jgi:hypothetical protein